MSRNTKRVLIVLAVAALIGAYFAFDLGQYLNLDYVKSQQARFRELYADHTVAVIGAYFVIYVVMAALSLPGAAVMTLLGGALFGFFAGLAVVSFASTLGATLACAVARYLFRGPVLKKFGERLSRINRGVEREGAFYLFTLRLIPVFPFFVINLAMGLTPIRLWTFYWVSQLGMLPGTAVYVNAGKELGELERLSGILSPGLIISFVLIGVFPLATKKVLGWYRARRGETAVPGTGTTSREDQ